MTFTVKHRESPALGGGECLYSAETIEVVYPGPITPDAASRLGNSTPASIQMLHSRLAVPPQAGAAQANVAGAAELPGNYFEAGIFLDREPPPAPGEDRTRFSKHIILFGGDQTQSAAQRQGGKVWVMNEAGATVATYDL